MHEAQSLDTRQGWVAEHVLGVQKRQLHMSEGEAAVWERKGGHYEQVEVGLGGVKALPALQVGRGRRDLLEELG